MNLEQIYNKKSPWPARESQKVLFILDVRSSLEEEVLRGWVQHHGGESKQAFEAPQVSIDLKDERTGFDSGQLVMSLAPRRAEVNTSS